MYVPAAVNILRVYETLGDTLAHLQNAMELWLLEGKEFFRPLYTSVDTLILMKSILEILKVLKK